MDGRLESFSAFSSSTHASSSTLKALSKCWFTTKGIILSVQPSLSSELRRKDVVSNIRKRILHHFGCEVFVFGSMPLKTYIPDGDIDLTVVTNRNVDDISVDIFNMLQEESQNDTEFQVTNLKLIPAQVKILKCIVQNISVDISFNQMAGLCAVCYFEQVDRVIGKSHLFKESLLLVKAWCYYESRIVGAHHGLISTYALETLVLFIINIFHASINGPLAVLYKFLSYFSTFEWDKYAITINGAVPISSLQTVSDMPKDVDDQQLLHPYFLRTCKSIFSATENTFESGALCFLVKDMNIVDPLNDNNNLGRSVSTSNLHRIKCALTYGAEKLEEVLGLPGIAMQEELQMFFATTLDRNGRGVRPDLPVPSPFGFKNSKPYDLTGDVDTSLDALHLFKWHLSTQQFYQVNQEASTEDFNYFHPNWQLSTDEMGYGRLNEQFALAGYDLGDTVLNEIDTSFRVTSWENFGNLSSVDFKPYKSPRESLERMHHLFENMHLGARRETSQSSHEGILGRAPQHCVRIQQTVPLTNHEDLPDLTLSQTKSSSGYTGGTGPCTVVDQPSSSGQEVECSADKIHSEQYRLQDNEDFPPLSDLVDASKKTNKAKGHR